MCKQLDLTKPLQVRRCDDYHKDEIRPAKLLDPKFMHQRGLSCILVQFKCSDGSDTAQVFSPTGEFEFALHPAVRGFTLENTPQKKKFYLYELHTLGAEPSVKHTMRAEPVRWMTNGHITYKLLKEVEVEL